MSKMSYTDIFKNDIFISYTHIDNRPLPKRDKGWVSHFHDYLSNLLDELLGDKAHIWRDIKTQGNDEISKLFFEEIVRTAALICILSPRYLKSHWCQEELKEFCTGIHSQKIDTCNKSRIFKVIKTPIPDDKYPQELQDLRGYNFYEIDKQTERPHIYRPEFGGEDEKKFFDKVYDIAYDVSKLLEIIKEYKEDLEKVPPQKIGPAIFLAQTTPDLNSERDKIVRELQQHGYTVYPEEELPSNLPDFQQKVLEYLDRSQISIHLIGGKYGKVLEGETRSIVDLQYELAAKKCMADGFKRLVWIPPDLLVKEKRQKDFIDYIENDPNALQGAELFKTPIEEFKTNIETILKNGKLREKKYKKEEAPIQIYLICDQQDLDIVQSLKEFLFNEGYEVAIPLFEGDENQIREDHKENLSMCDAILIFCQDSNEAWLRAKLRELRKIRGYSDCRPKLSKAIFLGAPATPWKEQVQTREALVIQNYHKFTPDLLKQFLDEIEKGREIE